MMRDDIARRIKHRSGRLVAYRVEPPRAEGQLARGRPGDLDTVTRSDLGKPLRIDVHPDWHHTFRRDLTSFMDESRKA
jgi:hypothetical protein